MEEHEVDPQSAAAAMPKRELPRTAKGRRTRYAILEAARVCFGEAGYTGTRIQDITERAGLSLGAFYRYFDSRREVLLAILAEFFDSLYKSSRSPWRADDPGHSVRETTIRYLEGYSMNADLYRLAYETFLTDPDVSRIWDDARHMFYRRIERSLRRGQAAGLVREDVDSALSAVLLGGMAEQYAFSAFVVRSSGVADNLEKVADEISALWIGGVATDGPS